MSQIPLKELKAVISQLTREELEVWALGNSIAVSEFGPLVSQHEEYVEIGFKGIDQETADEITEVSRKVQNKVKSYFMGRN